MIRLRIGLALLVARCLFSQQTDQQGESDLRTGITLTREGQFQQALPHFLSARGRVTETFALEFNLALCYVGNREFKQAIQILRQLKSSAEVDNLLSQALIGDGQQDAALKALQAAAALTPKNEKLYLLVSEACLDEGFHELGIQVLNVGLQNLPESARLYFERGLFRSQMDLRSLANQDFEVAQKLSPGSDIAYIAAAQQAFLTGDVQKVIRTALEGISHGHDHYLLLTMLGEALLRAGATPATPDEFREAQAALEKADGFGLAKRLLPVTNTRKIGKNSMILNSSTPRMEINPETYEVRADGRLLTCEPAKILPMAQRYFMY